MKMRNRVRNAVVITTLTALVATGCGTPVSREAGLFGGSGANPLDVPALSSVAGASGNLLPVFSGSTLPLSDQRLVATSTEPVLDATKKSVRGVVKKVKNKGKGANGSYQYWIGDLTADPASSAGWKSLSGVQANGTVKVAKGILVDGNAYQWKARDAAGSPLGPVVFTVDTARVQQQGADEFAGVAVSLSSGIAQLNLSTHQVASAAGAIGLGLEYQPGNDPWAGMPQNWRMVTPTSANWDQLVVPNDSAAVVRLHAKVGSWLTYRHVGNGSYEPVWPKNQPAPTGRYPTLLHNAADPSAPWTLTDIDQTVITFGTPNQSTRVAPVSSISMSGVLGLGQTYDDSGRLTAITDPVSSRKVTLEYGGGDCSSVGDGFVDAPAGQLCKVKYWDDSETWVGYVNTATEGAQIGRVVEFPTAGADGAQVTDVAYDNVGRLARMRTPLVTAAAAAHSATGVSDTDDSVLTAIDYDANGRVSKIKSGAPTPGGARMERNYVYSVAASDYSTYIKDQAGKIITRQFFDPNTFNPLKIVDADGRVGTYSYDAATGNVVSQTSQSGATTTYEYDPQTQLVAKQYGPTKSTTPNSSTPTRTFEYDQEYATPTSKGDAWTGLNFQVWSNPNWAGAPGSATRGPVKSDGTIPSTMNISWTTPPAGAGSGPWSLRLSGNVNIDSKDAGKYTFASPGSDLWIDGVKCLATACTNLELKAGPHSVRIDHSAPQGGSGGGVSLLMDKGATAKTPVPMKNLSPGYGLQTRRSANDQLTPSTSKVISQIAKFADPTQQRPSQVLTTAGTGTTTTYEPMASGDKQFGRATGVIVPGGSTSSFAYWKPDEVVAPPCEDHGKMQQGGMQSAINDPNPASGQPDGVKTRYWYTEGGRQAAMQYGDSTPSCTYYDDGGRVIATREGEGNDQKYTEVDYAADGNPLKSVLKYSLPSGNGNKVTEGTATVETDLFGREVRSTDIYGTVTEHTYDPVTGFPTVVKTRVNPDTAGEYVTIQTATYNTQNNTGTPASVSFTDNRGSEPLTAQWAYQSNGSISSVTLSNGTTGQYSYDQNFNMTGIAWSCSDAAKCKQSGGWSTKQTYAPSGRIMTAQTQAGADSASFNYSYDLDSRLSAASLQTSVKGLPKAWSYQYDGNSNRTSAAIDDLKISYAHDKADRLTKVTGDPVLSGDVKYDGNGSITDIGPLKMSYNASGRIATLTDSAKKTSIDYQYAGPGKLVAKATTTDAGRTEIRYSDAGLLLNAENQPYMQQIQIASNVFVQRPIAASNQNPKRSAAQESSEAADSAVPADSQKKSPAADAASGAAESGKPAESSPSATAGSGSASPSAGEPSEQSSASQSAAPSDTATPLPSPQPEAAAAAEPTGPIWNYQTLKGDTFWSMDSAGNPAKGGLVVYSPFGELLTPAVEPGSSTPNMRWASEGGVETESLSTGANLLGQRLYIPSLGRFTSTDPVQGGSANAYDYGNQDPINNSDASGESAHQWWTALKIIAIGVLVFTAAGAFGASAGIASSATDVAAASKAGSAIGMVAGAMVGAAAYSVSHMSDESSTSWQGWVAACVGGAVLGAIAGAQRSASLVRAGIADGAKAAEATAGRTVANPLERSVGRGVERRAMEDQSMSGRNIANRDGGAQRSSPLGTNRQERKAGAVPWHAEGGDKPWWMD